MNGEGLQERAAIMQYCGNLTRATAEVEALESVDWARIVLEIRRSGLTDTQIGEVIGRCRHTVNAIVNDPMRKGMQFAQGVALLNLHYDRCGA